MQQTHKCSSDIKFRCAWGFLGAVCLIMVQDRLSATHPSVVTRVTCLTRRWEARVAAGPYSEAEPVLGVVRVCSCYPRMVLFLSDAWLYCLISWL